MSGWQGAAAGRACTLSAYSPALLMTCAAWIWAAEVSGARRTRASSSPRPAMSARRRPRPADPRRTAPRTRCRRQAGCTRRARRPPAPPSLPPGLRRRRSRHRLDRRSACARRRRTGAARCWGPERHVVRARQRLQLAQLPRRDALRGRDAVTRDRAESHWRQPAPQHALRSPLRAAAGCGCLQCGAPSATSDRRERPAGLRLRARAEPACATTTLPHSFRRSLRSLQ